MVWIFRRVRGFLMISEPFGSIPRQSPHPPTPGRARPAWAGLGQQGQAGWLAGWLLAGWLPLVCVVCCDCVCACACARVCCVLCVAGKQGHEEGGLSNRAKCSARSRSSLRSLASLATLAKLARSARLRSLAAHFARMRVRERERACVANARAYVRTRLALFFCNVLWDL